MTVYQEQEQEHKCMTKVLVVYGEQVCIVLLFRLCIIDKYVFSQGELMVDIYVL